MNRVTHKKGKLTLTPADHYTMFLVFHNLPLGRESKEQVAKWNLKKPGGWMRYEEDTNKKAKDIRKVIEDEDKSVEEVVENFEKIHNKIKFQAFGKTRLNSGKMKMNQITGKEVLQEEQLAKELLKRQSKNLEEEIQSIKEIKNGRATKVFKLREVIQGPKKQGQEASAVKDPNSKEMVFSPKEIQRVSLRYCKQVLTNNKPDSEYEKEIKIKEKIHDVRMEEKSEGNIWFTEEDFKKVVDKMKKKKKKTYDFLVNSGNLFQSEVFRLCVRMITEEKFPSSFDKTTLHQIFKGKGLREELGNNRFIHSKEWLPRTCDFLVVEKMKPYIVQGTTKFQIGGIEKHRPQEHLFSVKSILAMYSENNINIIFQLYDIQKYFDKENLRDAMNTLYQIGVDPKLYRAWFNLNKNTVIRVKTGTGYSEWANAGELIGQGTGGGALVSSVNLDNDMEEFFAGSSSEVTYGEVRLQPLMFQDDVVRLAGDIASARAGNQRLEKLVKLKQLEMHPDKTGMIIFGNQKNLVKEITERPVMFNDFETKSKVMDKWLGELFHMDGLGASVEATVKERLGKIKAAIREAVSIVEDFRMQMVGGAMAAFDLWEAAILPALMYNSETWVDITTKTVETLDNIQNYFRMLLQVPESTPKPSLLSETGLMSMKYRIWSSKLIFVNVLKNMPEGTLAKQIFNEQVKRGWPGLAREASIICKDLGLPNIIQEKIRKVKWEKMVKKAARDKHEDELKLEVESKTKLEGIKDEDMKRKEYFHQKSLEDTRLLFRIRTRMVDLKANFKNKPAFRKDGWICEGCHNEVETNGHVMSCEAYEHVREGKNLDSDKDLVQFFKEILKIRMKKMMV